MPQQPSPVQTFNLIGGPEPDKAQGPFMSILQNPLAPAPPISQLSPSTGWESTGVGVGKTLLNFLQGVHGARQKNFIEQDRRTQADLDNYWRYVQTKASDPDLNEAGRQAVMEQGVKTLAEHAKYNLKDADRKGVGGFFKNILDYATGGPTKARDPLDFTTERGAISQLAEGHSQSANFQSAVTRAGQVIDQMKQKNGGYLIPSEVNTALLPLMTEVATKAPQYAETFPKMVASMVPDPLADIVQKAALDWTKGGGMGSAASAPAAPTQLPTQAPTAPPPQLPATMLHLGAGVGAAVPIPQMDIRPADTPVSAPPPTAEGPRMDLRSPVAGLILQKFGKKAPQPTTVYNLSNLSEAQTNVVRDPWSGKLVSLDTGQFLPDRQQSWVPYEEVKTPSVSQDVVVSGSPGSPTGNPQLLLGNRHDPNATRAFTMNGQPIYSNQPLEEVQGPTGAIRVVRSAAAGQAVPPSQGLQHEAAVKSAAEQALQSAGKDYLLAQDRIDSLNVPDPLKNEARALLQAEFNKQDMTVQMTLRAAKMRRDRAARATAAPPSAPPAAAAAAPAAAAAAPLPSQQFRR